MTLPAEELAQLIAKRLEAEGLLTPEDATRTTPKIRDGKMLPEDWRLAVEKTTRVEIDS